MATRGESASRHDSRAEPGRYRIGTVAQLTGIDEHTIRAWERRHGAVTPARSAGGTRLYGDRDVSRLRLLRALTDCGDPIGRIAGLDDAALRERLARLSGLGAGPVMGPLAPGVVRLAAVDPLVAGPLRAEAGSVAGLETVLAVDTLAEALARSERGAVDAVAVGLRALGHDPAHAVRRLLDATGAAICLVVYDFARRAELSELRASGARLARGPLRLPELRQLLFDLLAVDRAQARHRVLPEPGGPDGELGAPPERRFDDARLARLRELSSSIDCECPNHLSAIVEGLAAFERYASECESRSPVDARLHRRLARGTGHARAWMERLLEELCERDGIPL